MKDGTCNGVVVDDRGYKGREKKSKHYMSMQKTAVALGGGLIAAVLLLGSGLASAHGLFGFRYDEVDVSALPDELLEQKAESLGLSTEELRDALSEGQTFHEIVKASGVTRSELRTSWRSQHLERKAELLGMSVEALKAAKENGQSFYDLAEEQGVDLEAMRMGHMQEGVNQLLESGAISQEQVDLRLGQIENGDWPRRHGKRGVRYPHGFRK